MHQASDNSLYDIAKILLEAGADPNKQQADGSTALHNCVHRGNKEMIQLLLQYKANPRIQDFLVKII